MKLTPHRRKCISKDFIFFLAESSRFFLCPQSLISRFPDRNARTHRIRCKVLPSCVLFYRRLNKPRRYDIPSRTYRIRCIDHRSPRIKNWSRSLWARSCYRLRWRSSIGNSCKYLFHPCSYRNSDDRPYARVPLPLRALKPSALLPSKSFLKTPVPM